MPVIQNGDEIFEKFFLFQFVNRYYLKMLKNQKSKTVSLALYLIPGMEVHYLTVTSAILH